MKARAWFLILVLGACEPSTEPVPWKSMEVWASAYNSYGWQTQGDPSITAFGDTLKPGIKAIAVSRDLLDSGLGHNTPVYIHPLKDTFLVKDKMNRRWTGKIDIFMGRKLDSAREWGVRKLRISWPAEVED